MNRARYQQYLQSTAWSITRHRRLAASDNRCEFRAVLDWDTKHGSWLGERCAETDGLEVHHQHYCTLGAEEDADMEVLCRFHHLVRHASAVECGYCGETIQTDDAVAIDVVRDAIARAGGEIRKVGLDDISPHNVCDYCEHLWSR